MIKTAVIIAGGQGERLKPLTNDRPKAMAPVAGRPLLYWVATWLRSQGIENLVLGVAYRKERIYEFMAEQRNMGLNVAFSEHTLTGGTAQGFRLAISRHVNDEDFLAMNCDEITNLSVGRMEALHVERKPLVTMALAPFHCRFSVAEVGGDGMVRGFQYGHVLNDVPVSIGVYLFNRQILDFIPETGSIEDQTFAPLARQGRIAAYRLGEGEHWVSVNDTKNIREAEEVIASDSFRHLHVSR